MTRPLVRRRDALVSAALSVPMALPFVASAVDASSPVIALSAASATFVAALFVSVSVRRLEREHALTRSSTQASCELAAALAPYPPLPPMGGWAAHPEFAAACARIVLTRAPRRVVELGSGVSTVVLAMALERTGGGHVVSLDHDSEFGASTRRSLEARGLSARATVRHAPLVAVEGRTRTYDLAGLEDEPIDVLVVDGPPNGDGEGARTAALLALADRLSPNAVVLVDDAARSDERRMVEQFVARSRGAFRATFVESSKGVAILERTVPTP